MINIRLGKHHNHPEHSIRLFEEIKNWLLRQGLVFKRIRSLLETEQSAELIRETAEL